MRKLLLVLMLTVCGLTGNALAQKDSIPNPAIDMKGYLKLAQEAARHRESRRLTEEEFIKMSHEPDVIILDARSKERYD